MVWRLASIANDVLLGSDRVPTVCAGQGTARRVQEFKALAGPSAIHFGHTNILFQARIKIPEKMELLVCAQFACLTRPTHARAARAVSSTGCRAMAVGVETVDIKNREKDV